MAVSWEYIAGFFDGEGCVYLNTTRCRISINQLTKNERVLLEIKETLANAGIPCWVCTAGRREGPSGRMSNLVFGSVSGCYVFLMKTMPFLIVKKEKALQAIALLEPKLRHQADFDSRMELAMADYVAGVSSHQIFNKYRIYHSPLRLHLKRRGIRMRTRSEANILGKAVQRLRKNKA